MASENTTVIDVIARLTDETSPRLRAIQGNIDRFGASVERIRRQARRLTAGSHTVQIDARDRATASITRVSAGIKNISGKTFNFTMKMIDFATKPLRSIFNFATSLKTIVAGVVAGIAIDKTILQHIDLADSYSSALIGFETLFKSKEKALKMMDDIDAFAQATPFKTSGVIANSQKMIAMGWKPEELIRDMKTLGDAAAATGKGDEGFDTIIRALSQIKTKGKLSTEELNQLAEAGIRAKGYLAEGLGYGTSDAGMAMLAKDIEKGAIGSEKAISLLLDGMKEYEGMMDKTANETVGGLKSQIQDTFEISIIRKWGQGLQEGAKKGLGSIVTLLNKSEDGLSKIGDIGQGIAAKFSNKLADGLDTVIQKLGLISDTKAFKGADLGGKFKILWGSIIEEPFHKWWNSSGQQFVSNVAFKVGNGIGSFFKGSIIAILGIAPNGITEEGMSIGESFADGFLQGFNPPAVGKALLEGFKNISLDASTILPGGEKASGTSAISAGLLAFLGLKVGKGLGANNLARRHGVGGAASRGVSGVAAGREAAVVASRGVSGVAAGAINQVDDYTAFWQNARLWNTTSRSAVVAGQEAAEASAARMAATTQRYGQFFDDISVRLAPAIAHARPILGKVAKFFKGNWLSVLFAGAAIAQAENKASETVKQGGGILGSMGGTSLGMAIGTAIAPGIGTAIGGLIGSLSGYVVGERAGKEVYETMESGVTYEERQYEKQKRAYAEQRVNQTVEIRTKMVGTKEQKQEVADLAKQWNDVRWELNQGGADAEKMAAKQAEMEAIIGRLSILYPELIDMSDTENQKLDKKLGLAQNILSIEEKRARLDLEKQVIENKKSFGVVEDNYGKSKRNMMALEGKEDAFNEKSDNIENLGLQIKGLQTEKQVAFDNGNIAIAALKIAEIQINMNKINAQAKELGVKKDFSLTEVTDASYTGALLDQKEKLIDALSLEYENNEKLKGLYQEMYDAELAMIEIELGEPIEEAVKHLETMDEKQKVALGNAINSVNNLNGAFKELDEYKHVEIIIDVKGKIPNVTENRTTTMGPFLGPSQSSNYKISGFDSKPYGNAGNSHGNPRIYASGGVVNKPHIGLVGEAGAEAIIPLTGTNKHRGIKLWEQAGQMLGTIPKHAQGGIFGKQASNLQEAMHQEGESRNENNTPISVNVGGMNFEFKGVNTNDPEGVMNTIRAEMPQIANEMAETLEKMLTQVFSNMKLEAEGI